MRRRCGWCGTRLRWWQLDMCKDCKRDFVDDVQTPKHREASRWEKWLDNRPDPREVDLPPTTTEVDKAEEEQEEREISLRWHEKVEKSESRPKKGEKAHD